MDAGDVNDDSDIGWPPRPWDLEWAKRWTSLPEELWGVLSPEDDEPDPVTNPEPCAWCDTMPASSGGWAPGEFYDHWTTAHPELIQPPSERIYPPREPGVVLPPAP